MSVQETSRMRPIRCVSPDGYKQSLHHQLFSHPKLATQEGRSFSFLKTSRIIARSQESVGSLVCVLTRGANCTFNHIASFINANVQKQCPKSIVELERQVARHVAQMPPQSQEHKVLPPNISVVMHDNLSTSPRKHIISDPCLFLNVARHGQSCLACNVKASVAMSCSCELSHFPIGTIQVARVADLSTAFHLYIGEGMVLKEITETESKMNAVVSEDQQHQDATPIFQQHGSKRWFVVVRRNVARHPLLECNTVSGETLPRILESSGLCERGPGCAEALEQLRVAWRLSRPHAGLEMTLLGLVCTALRQERGDAGAVGHETKQHSVGTRACPSEWRGKTTHQNDVHVCSKGDGEVWHRRHITVTAQELSGNFGPKPTTR